MNIADLLKSAITQGASDLHMKAGKVPRIRKSGELLEVPGAPVLSAEASQAIAFSMMNDHQRVAFEKKGEADLAYSYPGVGRFRVNVFKQRGSVGIVFRVVPTDVMSIDQLNLPNVFHKLAMEPRGLILVTGSTGSGKSTTLASLVDHINHNRAANIITVEDPIEYLYRDDKSFISQREVGYDTDSFGVALRAALRQDPDVILVGEMRDFETIHTALTAAETGHLVMSTLHTVDAPETINRVISVFPPFQQKQVRMQLAAVLKGVISQRLVPTADGNGRVAACEVMISTQTVREAIIDPEKTRKLRDVIAAGGSQYGMQTFDQALFDLLKRNIINEKDAMSWSSNPDDFALKLQGVSSTSDSESESGSDDWGGPPDQQPEAGVAGGTDEDKGDKSSDFVERF